jgi:hypothetical protein
MTQTDNIISLTAQSRAPLQAAADALRGTDRWHDAAVQAARSVMTVEEYQTALGRAAFALAWRAAQGARS